MTPTDVVELLKQAGYHAWECKPEFGSAGHEYFCVRLVQSPKPRNMGAFKRKIDRLGLDYVRCYGRANRPASFITIGNRAHNEAVFERLHIQLVTESGDAGLWTRRPKEES